MDNKLAILISGPYRYLRFMLGRMRLEAYNLNYDFDVFIHVWSQDLGVKKREEVDELNSDKIRREFPFVKVMIVEKPFLDQDFAYLNPNQFEAGQSNPASVMGMFIGLSRLINCIENSPIKYSHVLRLRTDMIIFGENFYENLEKYMSADHVHTSQNYLIPYKWLSDHIILAPTKYFVSLWPNKIDIKFYKNYKKIGLNPEKFLAFQAKKFQSKIKPTFIRYSDYQIVYSTQNKNDPSWVKKITRENRDDVFLDPLKYLTNADRMEINEIITKQKKNQDYYALPKLKKIFIKIFNEQV